MAISVPSPQDSVRVIRVFLASPSDLAEERKAAHDAVGEVNKTIARPAGFHVDLIGWEDTISAQRRPQSIINDDLRTCQMFVGMLWARWGTPPDKKGPFTSGFEEEFSIATMQYTEMGYPYPRLYFKDVDEAQLKDPGPELQKVLDFKKKIIDGKKILFETFSNASDFAQKVRISVADYINRLRREDDEANQNQKGSSQAPSEAVEEQSAFDSEETTIEVAFLKDVASKLARQSKNSIRSVEVARLRNLATSLSKAGNDQTSLQAHDANLIYLARSELTLSVSEISSLADAGLAHISNENVPLWSWVADRLAYQGTWLTISTIIGTEREKVGAFRALALLGLGVDESKEIVRDKVVGDWFEASVSADLRNAALRYLGSNGVSADVDLIEREIARNDSSTLQTALEAGVALTLREAGSRASAEFVLAKSFDRLPGRALAPALSAFDQLDTAKLEGALQHRSPVVRSSALDALRTRGSINTETARELLADASTSVREVALSIISDLEAPPSLEEVKAVLLRPEKTPFGADTEGEAAIARKKVRDLEIAPLKDLEALASEPDLSLDAYIVLCGRRFTKCAQELRKQFDDRFRSRLNEYKKGLKARFGDASVVDLLCAQVDKSERWTRRLWMRKAADVLTARGNYADLGRIRRALDEDELDPRHTDIAFLGQHGSWEDVSRVSSIYSDYRASGYGASLLGRTYPTALAADALLRIAAKRIPGLLAVGLPSELLAAVIARMPKSSFVALTDEQLTGLLNHKDKQPRKLAALRVIDALPAARGKKLFAAHMAQKSHFYNVVHWLDLLMAFPAARAKQSAHREIEAITSGWATAVGD